MPIWPALLDRAAARNPATPVTALTRLAKTSTDGTVLHNLAVNPRATEDTLNALVSPGVRLYLSQETWQAVATHPQCTEEIADIVAQCTAEVS